METRVSSFLAPADKMPVSVLAAAASFLILLPSCPSAAINPGLEMPWGANNGDFMWEDELYPVSKKTSTSSLNPRLAWLSRSGTQQTDGTNYSSMQRRGGGIRMVKRHPSPAVAYTSRKRQQYMATPYHPLARFRGLDSPSASIPMLGPYRPSPPFALPLAVASYGPRPDPTVTEFLDQGTEDDEFDKGDDIAGLSAGQILSILSAVARERGLAIDWGRHNKGLRFGLTRRR